MSATQVVLGQQNRSSREPLAERVYINLKQDPGQVNYPDWGWGVTQAIIQGLNVLGETVSAAIVLAYVETGVDGLLMRVMTSVFNDNLCANWPDDVVAYSPRGLALTADEVRDTLYASKVLPAMISFYLGVVKPLYRIRHEAIDALLDVHHHDRGHFNLMSNSLKFALAKLSQNDQ